MNESKRPSPLWLLLLLALAAMLFLIRQARKIEATPTEHNTDSAASPETETPPASLTPPPNTEPARTDAGGIAVQHTTRDPALHQSVRSQLLRTLGIAPNGSSPSPTSQPAPPEPAGGTLDPNYLRGLIREEFVPMARVCYDQLLERHPGAGGRVTLTFVVLAEQNSGGIVDEVGMDARDGGSWDDTFRTCMQETMRTMVFRAPTGGGRVTVRYPFSFAPPDAS